MSIVTHIAWMKIARDKLADVFQGEAQDSDFDNGMLDQISKATQLCEAVIKDLEARSP